MKTRIPLNLFDRAVIAHRDHAAVHAQLHELFNEDHAHAAVPGEFDPFEEVLAAKAYCPRLDGKRSKLRFATHWRSRDHELSGTQGGSSL